MFFDYTSTPFIAPGSTFRDINKINWRCEMLIGRNLEHIRDKKILDIACANGTFSYSALVGGAKHVTGIDARACQIEDAKKLVGKEFPERTTFIESDIFDYLATVKPGEFDTIFCFGFLYHTLRQVELILEIHRLNPHILLVDTTVLRNYFVFGRKGVKKPPCLLIINEDPNRRINTINPSGMAAVPSVSFLEEMFKMCGWSYRRINYWKAGITNWAGCGNYMTGNRTCYIVQIARYL